MSLSCRSRGRGCPGFFVKKSLRVIGERNSARQPSPDTLNTSSPVLFELRPLPARILHPRFLQPSLPLLRRKTHRTPCQIPPLTQVPPATPRQTGVMGLILLIGPCHDVGGKGMFKSPADAHWLAACVPNVANWSHEYVRC